MKTNTKWWLFCLTGLLVAGAVATGLKEEEQPWKMGDPLDARYWKMVERQLKYSAEHPAPSPRVPTPEERIESSVQRTERMVRDIESKQEAMQREMEWQEATRHWNLR